MKTHLLRLALVFTAFSFTASAYAGDYFIYQDRDGKLVISNQKPPEGSKIIRKRTSDDSTDNNQIQEARRPNTDEPQRDNREARK